MTYQEYINHLKVCEFLGKEPAGKFKEVHDFLTGLWNGMEEIVVISHNDWIVFRKGGNWFFEQDLKSGYLRFNYDQVWSFFKKDMGMELTEIPEFVKSMVEEHLKCEVGTPVYSAFSQSREVEEHLKCEVGTPHPCTRWYEA